MQSRGHASSSRQLKSRNAGVPYLLPAEQGDKSEVL